MHPIAGRLGDSAQCRHRRINRRDGLDSPSRIDSMAMQVMCGSLSARAGPHKSNSMMDSHPGQSTFLKSDGQGKL
jgi:hypothetical protein